MRMVTTTSTYSLCVWQQVRRRTCHLLPKRRISMLWAPNRISNRWLGNTWLTLSQNCQQSGRGPIRYRGTKFLGGRRDKAECIFCWKGIQPIRTNLLEIQHCHPPETPKKWTGENKSRYEERVRGIEHGSFSPLVFSAAGEMGNTATVVYMYQRLASLLAKERNITYITTLHWLRCPGWTFPFYDLLSCA